MAGPVTELMLGRVSAGRQLRAKGKDWREPKFRRRLRAAGRLDRRISLAVGRASVRRTASKRRRRAYSVLRGPVHAKRSPRKSTDRAQQMPSLALRRANTR